MERNILREWSQYILEHKWKTGRVQEEIFKLTKQTEEIIKNFFSEKDYTINNNQRSYDNYLIDLLSSRNEKDIHLLNELAKLINFSEECEQVFNIKSKQNKVRHSELGKLLFEVYISMFLRYNKFSVIHNYKYYDKDNLEKPTDSFFIFENTNYLVECYKISNYPDVKFSQIGIDLMDTFYKSKIQNFKLFKGMIGYKTDTNLAKNIVISQTKALKIYKQFDAGISNNQTMSIPNKFTSEHFDIEILPYYWNNKIDYEESLNNLYKAIIIFEIKPDLYNTNRGTLSVKVTKTVKTKLKNQEIANKITEKYKQHKDFKDNKIFFIEIDNTVGPNSNNPIFPILLPEELDIKLYENIIERNPETILVIIFKKANNFKIVRNVYFIANENHSKMIKKLRECSYDFI